VIPELIDAELREIAEKAAGKHPDTVLAAMGWTRAEYVTGIHARLRRKFVDMRSGQ
jgi:hypothetical protein